jgi:hypothetical protein
MLFNFLKFSQIFIIFLIFYILNLIMLKISNRSDQKIKNFYNSNLRIKIRKVIKEILQKDEKVRATKMELRLETKKFFDKIYGKINKRKINYFQINENIIEEIMYEKELKKESLQESITENPKFKENSDSQLLSFTQNSYKSGYSSSTNNEISYPINFLFEEKIDIFNIENTLENYLHHEKLSEKLKKYDPFNFAEETNTMDDFFKL